MDASELEAKAAELRRQAKDLEDEAILLRSPAECRQAAKEISERKGKVAVFLGAGASRTFGWPLTSQLLPMILDGLIDENLFEDWRVNTKPENVDDRAILRKAIKALCPGIQITTDYLTQNRNRLPLVTSLLSMLDYSLASGQALVLGLSADEIKSARSLLERAIYERIERDEKTAIGDQWRPRQPNDYTIRLAQWLDEIRESPSNVGVITSNYDVAIEKAWGIDRCNEETISDLALDLGFDWFWPSDMYELIISRPVDPGRRLYKLHGSTNWLRCGLDDRIYINPKVDIAVYAYARKVLLSNKCHCGHAKLEVQIVSPSFVREMRAPNLISVWQQALKWLRQADDWIVIGYSFPDEDLNIRSLFTRALASRRRAPYVTAIQLGVNEQTRTRYEAFFPKDRITFLDGGLKTFLDNTKELASP